MDNLPTKHFVYGQISGQFKHYVYRTQRLPTMIGFGIRAVTIFMCLAVLK